LRGGRGRDSAPLQMSSTRFRSLLPFATLHNPPNTFSHYATSSQWCIRPDVGDDFLFVSYTLSLTSFRPSSSPELASLLPPSPLPLSSVPSLWLTPYPFWLFSICIIRPQGSSFYISRIIFKASGLVTTDLLSLPPLPILNLRSGPYFFSSLPSFRSKESSVEQESTTTLLELQPPLLPTLRQDLVPTPKLVLPRGERPISSISTRKTKPRSRIRVLRRSFPPRGRRGSS